MRNPYDFLPQAISMTRIETANGFNEEPVDYGEEDKAIANMEFEKGFINILRILPNDKYRTIALMLLLNDLGMNYRYEDIAEIWDESKVNVHHTVRRMRAKLKILQQH